MRKNTARRFTATAVAALTALTLAACNGDDDATDTPATTTAVTTSTTAPATTSAAPTTTETPSETATSAAAPVEDEQGGPQPTLSSDEVYEAPAPVYEDPAPAYEAPAPAAPGCATPVPINGGPGDGCGNVRDGLVNPNPVPEYTGPGVEGNRPASDFGAGPEWH